MQAEKPAKKETWTSFFKLKKNVDSDFLIKRPNVLEDRGFNFNSDKVTYDRTKMTRIIK